MKQIFSAAFVAVMLQLFFSNQNTKVNINKLLGAYMNNLTRFLIAVFFATLSISAHAGSSSGYITQILVVADTATFSAGTHNSKPACSTVGEDWSVSLSSPGGRAMYAMLLSAFAQHLAIGVSGTGGCTAWPDRETPNYIWINSP
jgi:hypothetical protein